MGAGADCGSPRFVNEPWVLQISFGYGLLEAWCSFDGGFWRFLAAFGSLGQALAMAENVLTNSL